MSDALPRALGRYQIEQEIARGMMGIVYRARDPALGRTVALKTVQLAFRISEADKAVFQERFLTEARLAAALSHPNIVVVHDLGWADGTLFIAFEYLEGLTLDQFVGDGPAEWRVALRIAAKVAEALHYAHQRGIVHRDIKPANIMVLPSGEPKIMDFGVAKAPASQLTAAGEFFGTPAYMSPEQASGTPLDGRSDIFSLGSVLYRLLTGRRAFEGPSVPTILNKVAHEDPPPPSQLRPELTPEVDALVMAALAKDPARRYPDGQTLAADIEEVLEGRPPRFRPLATGEAVATLTAAQPGSQAAPAPEATRRSGTLFGRVSKRVQLLALLGVALVAGLVGRTIAPRPGPAPEPSPPAAPPSAAATPAPVATPAPRPAPSRTPAPAIETARLALQVEYGIKKGRLNVYVDGERALSRAIEGEEQTRALVFKSAEGRLTEVIPIEPGVRDLMIEVLGGSQPIRGRLVREPFKRGETRLLEVKVDDRISLKFKS